VTLKLTILLFLILLAFYGGIYTLWLWGDHAVYFSIMHYVVAAPFKTPFIDMTGPLSWAECYRLGYDVLRVNPCDPLGRLLNYSPLIVYLPLGTHETVAAALVQDSAFIIALPLIIRPQAWREFWIALAMCLSTTVALALERGQFDVGLFVLMASTALMVRFGQIGRLGALVTYFIGGVIKFYPFAALTNILRERPRVALATGAIFGLLITIFAVQYYAQLREVANDLIYPRSWGAQYVGAFVLSFGLAARLRMPDWFAVTMLASLLVVFGANTAYWTMRLRTTFVRVNWDEPNFHFLLLGAIIVAGCFLLQMNLSYKFIFLLLTLSGLLQLRREASAASLERLFAAAVVVSLYCLWSRLAWTLLVDLFAWIELPPSLSVVEGAVNWLFLVGSQLAWWWLVSVLVAIVLNFVVDSSTVRALVAGMSSRSDGRAKGGARRSGDNS
jgi:hypothetical protein